MLLLPLALLACVAIHKAGALYRAFTYYKPTGKDAATLAGLTAACIPLRICECKCNACISVTGISHEDRYTPPCEQSVSIPSLTTYSLTCSKTAYGQT